MPKRVVDEALPETIKAELEAVPETPKLVVVAEVVVDRIAVKFWRVLEELARICWNEETNCVPVAVKLSATTPVEPTTEKAA